MYWTVVFILLYSWLIMELLKLSVKISQVYTYQYVVALLELKSVFGTLFAT